MSLAELHEEFNKLLDTLSDFFKTYSKTEAEMLTMFEGDQTDSIRAALTRVGEARFALRKASEDLFFILLGGVVQEAVERFEIDGFDVYFYTFDEIQNAFNGILLDSAIVAERKDGYALLNMHETSELIVGERYEEIWQRVESMTTVLGSVLQGKSAYPGVVRGIVECMLHNDANLAERANAFLEGRILVTEMTTPDTVLACKKASAIVTDEGGVLCHAAIISRELQKPCVVGTKVATQKVKTGDEIEVNAHTGAITILKQA